MYKLKELLKFGNNISISAMVRKQILRLLEDNADVILFGAGIGGSNTLQFLQNNIDVQNCRIKCFADNNPLKRNTMFHGVKVMSCQDAFSQYKGELVIISCGEGDEIIRQLTTEYRIPMERIYIPDISAIDETDPVYIKQHIKSTVGCMKTWLMKNRKKYWLRY